MIKRYLGYDFDEYTADNFPYDKLSDNLAPIRGRGIRPEYRSKKYYSARVCAFDIETTIIEGTERTCMYHWQFSFDNEYYCCGRTWKEFQDFLVQFSKATNECIMTVCVHNLAYEFYAMRQFLYEAFMFSEVSALMMNANAPLTYTVDNIKFIDTLRMSGTSLDKMCNDYNLYYKKATGDLDYKKLFNIETELTEEEKGYCLLDVASLVEWYHVIEKLRGYSCHNMPATKTGFIRTPLRKAMKPYKKGYYKGKTDDYKVFKMLREMFQGGLTCINPERRNDTIEGNIRCKDFTSSYPAVMCGKNYYYPISAYSLYAERLDLSKKSDLSDFLDLIENRCCMFRVRFYDLSLKPQYPTGIIASSKSLTSDDCAKENGKVDMAEWLEKVTNEVEFMDIITMYDYTDVDIFDLYTAQRGQLPEVMRNYILELFKQKTQLKGIKGKELDLLLCKGDINACYGMSAMNPLREVYNYIACDNEVNQHEPDEQELEDMYYKEVNKSNAFLHYRWGCYVTTWARHNIIETMRAIVLADNGKGYYNYLYTDTDSVYYISTPSIEEALAELDNTFTQGQITVVNETTGKADTLGMLCPDGEYIKFRGLGAKKYCLIKPDGSLKLTCAGVPKKTGGDMLGGDIDKFQAGFVFSGKYTNKLTPVRNDEPIHDELVNGVMTRTASNIYLKETDYVLSDSLFDDLINLNFDLYV